jgi:hypothetical protein
MGTLDNRVTPDAFAVNNRDMAYPSPLNDPLGVLDTQGARTVIDSHTDSLGVLFTPSPSVPPSRSAVDRDRLRSKMIDIFALSSNHDEKSVEVSRAAKLVKL